MSEHLPQKGLLERIEILENRIITLEKWKAEDDAASATLIAGLEDLGGRMEVDAASLGLPASSSSTYECGEHPLSKSHPVQ